MTVSFFNSVSGGVHQMCFSKPDSAVNKHRIIGFARRFGDCQSRGVGKLITRTDDECIKGIFAVERIFNRFNINKIGRVVFG